MKKVVLHFVLILVLFLGCWFGLHQIDWVRVFNVQKVTESTEEKLGDFYWDIIKSSEEEVDNKKITNMLDTLLEKICTKNNIKEKIKIHLIYNDETNAFALPNRHLVVYTGLILECKNEAELSGIICHEIGHIEQKHVMKKLIKEVGLSALISMTTGSGGEIGKKTIKMLSSSAYDRSLESEADIKAVDYLIEANINPSGLSDFLYRLSKEESDLQKNLFWMSTHPDSEQRALTLIEYSKNKPFTEQPILGEEKWNLLQGYFSFN